MLYTFGSRHSRYPNVIALFTALFVVLFVLGGAAAGVYARAPHLAAALEEAEGAFRAKQTAADGERAIALYEKVLDADARHVGALLRLAELHYWVGEMIGDEALPVLERGLAYAEQAVQLAQREADAHYWFAVLTGRIGEERGILQSLFMVKDIMNAVDRALELDDEHAGAHLVASQVYRKAPGWPLSVGDKKKAIEHGAEALRLEPNKTIHALNLAEAYLADRQRDKARELLEQVLNMPLTPGDEVISQQEKDEAARLLEDLR